jgi:protein involved in polysaccharide export with SLBB domain
VDLTRLLRDLERTTPTTGVAATGADMPEAPVAPPPTAFPEAALTEERPGEMTIQPDCLLQVAVEEDPQLDGSYPVNEIGAISLRYVGPIILYNKTEGEAEEKIRDVLRQRDFRKATVKVRILRASYDRVQLSGEVNRPGVITIGAGDTITLNEALLRAGGLKPAPGGLKLHVIRGGLLSAAPFALEPEEYSLMRPDGKPEIPAVVLRPNDIAHVLAAAGGSSAGAGGVGGLSEGEKEILVLGEVARAGIYRFAPNERCTVMHLVLKMGGLPPYANAKAVKVIRRHADGTEEEIPVNVHRLLERGDPDDDVTLQNGDRLTVPARRISLF